MANIFDKINIFKKKESEQREGQKEKLIKVAREVKKLIEELDLETNENINEISPENQASISKEYLLKQIKLKELMNDLAEIHNLNETELEEINTLIKSIEVGDIEINEENDLDKIESKNLLNFFRKNKALKYALISLALMFKVSTAFSSNENNEQIKPQDDQKTEEQAPENIKGTEPDPETTYYIDQEGPGDGEDMENDSESEDAELIESIKLDIYNKYIIDKADLIKAEQVKVDLQNFLNEMNLEDLQKLDQGNGIDLIITSGASPESTPTWNAESFQEFVKSSGIKISEADMEKFKTEAENTQEDQKGNYWLSKARGFSLQKTMIKSLEELATQGDEKAEYLLNNCNLIVENFPTLDQDFESLKPGQVKEDRLYKGDNPKFYKENGEPMTWAEVRNALVALEASKEIISSEETVEENDNIEKIPTIKPILKYELMIELTPVKFEKIISNYTAVVFDKSGSMGSTIPNFFIDQFKKAGEFEKISEIQKNMTNGKEVKNDRITIKNFKTLLYAGVSEITNSYSLDDEGKTSLIDILSDLEYNGYNERQINLVNQTLDNIILLIDEAEKDPSKSSDQLKQILSEKNIKLAMFTDEQIKYTQDQLDEYLNKKAELESRGYNVTVDIIFADKIGSSNAELINVQLDDITETLQDNIDKNPNRSNHNYSRVEIVKNGEEVAYDLEDVGEGNRTNNTIVDAGK